MRTIPMLHVKIPCHTVWLLVCCIVCPSLLANVGGVGFGHSFLTIHQCGPQSGDALFLPAY